MARVREFDPEAALDRAVELFWQKGYIDASIDDLVSATGVNRYGLYSTFGDKHALFLKALDRYRDQVVGHLLSGLEAPGAGLAEIEGYFRAVSAGARSDLGRNGCLLSNTAIELAHQDDAAADKVCAHFKRLQKAFRDAIKRAQAAGDLPARANVTELTDFLLGVSQGVCTMARAPINRSAITRFVEVSLATLRRGGDTA